tara:strand:- start:245 stop:574 length:330 start_codon:yes stop_codon:yes gene_type:complete
MEVQAYTKYVRISPKKLREVSREIQGMNVTEALDVLKITPRKAARLLEKTIKSAIANAENNHELLADNLIIEKALVEEGPAFKRFRPAARGSGHPYKKRTSHIKIVLSN